MFKQTKNIDFAFRQMRTFTFVIIISCISITVYSLYSSNQSQQRSASRVYILANGKILEALAADRKDNIPVEARDHIKMFHFHFFSLDPDDKVIQGNITKALYLADRSAKEQYDNLKENSYFSNIISGNISQSIEADSIQINMDRYPYYFRYYGKEKIVRPASVVTRSIITEGQLRNVSRSDNNPHGFLIENWKTVENRDLKTEAR